MGGLVVIACATGCDHTPSTHPKSLADSAQSSVVTIAISSDKGEVVSPAHTVEAMDSHNLAREGEIIDNRFRDAFTREAR